MLILLLMQFGNNLRKLRKDSGLTQQDLAKQAGVSQQIITHYETGTRSPTLEKAVKLAKALDVSVEDLFGDLKTKKPAEQKGRHRNSRSAKMQELFDKLPPGKQRSVYSHAKALASQK